jgi:hypothetical protein
MSFDQSQHFFSHNNVENMLPLAVSYHSSNTEGKNFTKINKDPP